MSTVYGFATAEDIRKVAQAVKLILNGPGNIHPPGERNSSMPAPFSRIIGKTAASHAKGASGTINVYHGTKGSETWDSSTTITAWNRMAAISSGKWVVCVDIEGWEVIAAEC